MIEFTRNESDNTQSQSFINRAKIIYVSNDATILAIKMAPGSMIEFARNASDKQRKCSFMVPPVPTQVRGKQRCPKMQSHGNYWTSCLRLKPFWDPSQLDFGIAGLGKDCLHPQNLL